MASLMSTPERFLLRPARAFWLTAARRRCDLAVLAR
jgi:hypothetical protein